MSDRAAACIVVEVIYALATHQSVQRLEVKEGCTAGEAVRLAGLEALWQPEGGSPRALACFGRLLAPETPLMTGDRVEILRPLHADPKDQRRQRADRARRSRRRGNPLRP